MKENKTKYIPLGNGRFRKVGTPKVYVSGKGWLTLAQWRNLRKD